MISVPSQGISNYEVKGRRTRADNLNLSVEDR